jgi:hypothetical protein
MPVIGIIEQSAQEGTRPHKEAALDRKEAAHFSLWVKGCHGGFKAVTKTEEAEVVQFWDILLSRDESSREAVRDGSCLVGVTPVGCLRPTNGPCSDQLEPLSKALTLVLKCRQKDDKDLQNRRQRSQDIELL